MTVKEEIVRLVDDLPEDCTYEEVHDRLIVLKKLREGLAAADRGELLSHEEVRDRIATWTRK